MRTQTIKIFTAGLLLAATMSVFAQAGATKTDTFKVLGNCEMCEKRIETAAKGKGVISADWNVDTKVLKLVYDPAKTTEAVVKTRIAKAGHDAGEVKAPDSVYKALPKCCRYDRE